MRLRGLQDRFLGERCWVVILVCRQCNVFTSKWGYHTLRLSCHVSRYYEDQNRASTHTASRSGANTSHLESVRLCWEGMVTILTCNTGQQARFRLAQRPNPASQLPCWRGDPQQEKFRMGHQLLQYRWTLSWELIGAGRGGDTHSLPAAV